MVSITYLTLRIIVALSATFTGLFPSSTKLSPDEGHGVPKAEMSVYSKLDPDATWTPSKEAE
jgi:hypothetical protein